MKKGTIIRYRIVKYKELENSTLFPYPINCNYLRLKTAYKELIKIKENDFANSAMYGLEKNVIPIECLSEYHGYIEK